MNKKVTMRELAGVRIVLAVCIAVYYWCWARNDWHSYYTTVTNVVAAFVICFFVFLAVRERKYKKEVTDELAVANFRRCDSICYKITMALIVFVGFLSAILRFAVSAEVIGYMLMSILVLMSIIRTILFCYMDKKGV